MWDDEILAMFGRIGSWTVPFGNLRPGTMAEFIACSFRQADQYLLR